MQSHRQILEQAVIGGEVLQLELERRYPEPISSSEAYDLLIDFRIGEAAARTVVLDFLTASIGRGAGNNIVLPQPNLVG